MSTTLRFFLILTSVTMALWVLHKIRKLKVKMESAIYWIVFSMALMLLAIFPQIPYSFATLLGIRLPVNFVFLSIIFMLLLKVFLLSVVVSELEEKVSILSTEIAIRSQSQQREIEYLEEQVENSVNG